MQIGDDIIRTSGRTIRQKFAVSFSYDPRTPDDEQRHAWADAKRKLMNELSAVLLPNRDYTIRYCEERKLGLFDWVECMVLAYVTYTE